MKFILKLVIGFAVVAFLTLLVFVYLEKKDGIHTSPSEILDDVKDVGKQAGDAVKDFVEDSGLKAGAQDLIDKGLGLISPSNP